MLPLRSSRSAHFTSVLSRRKMPGVPQYGPPVSTTSSPFRNECALHGHPSPLSERGSVPAAATGNVCSMFHSFREHYLERHAPCQSITCIELSGGPSGY